MSKWLPRRHKRPDAPLRLYVFPHSGGSAGEYLLWADDLPRVEVVGVQAPGRGGRVEEDAYTRMSDLVAAVVAEAAFTGPFAFFGHSLGAVVAYEVALALRAAGREGPRHLYASAHEAPHRTVPRPHALDDASLIAAVEAEHGPLPAEIHEDAEWRSLVLGGLRGDLGIVSTYGRTTAPPLDCPITAFAGADDEVAADDVAAWAGCTTGPFRLRVFAGGHFYFREQHDDILRFLAADLDAVGAR
ncbi:alpha/beta fold hydrolase [Saccharothrix violaceirubra]|uniref:Surfactin synthase thioesterase subunit n=1 Tax=Saccharothrix violaceirubra TaxID=413306 RepID=A0A7W7T209_9PSEU|nr:alpha/beta fold hydrolase [Saccharothrix violaceirubra]MBB4965123.1 surfactin synthase thioesterase subunit [Saccharothrix violaceirubra]